MLCTFWSWGRGARCREAVLLPGHWVSGTVQESLRAGPMSRGLTTAAVQAAVAQAVYVGAHSLFYHLN